MKNLNAMTTNELRMECKKLGIKGYSKMKHNELIKAIKECPVEANEIEESTAVETTEESTATEVETTEKTKKAKQTYLGEIPEEWDKKKVNAWKKHYREFFAEGGETVEEVTEEMNLWSPEYDEQANKPKREKVSRMIEYNGKTQTLTAWAKELGIRPQTLYGRIVMKGMSPEEALEKPIKKGKSKDAEEAETK